MPGLSQDPDAAARQLDGLARGRQSQAASLLEALGFTVKPGRKPGHQPGHVPGQPAVHAYPDPEPEPPHGPIPPEREPERREPERPAAGGLFSRLADGFRAGIDD